MQNRNRTLVENLPEINEMSPQVSKFIRNQEYNPPMESGMSVTRLDDEREKLNEPQYIPQFPSQFPSSKSDDELTCTNVAHHVKKCPICTHYYNSNILTYINIIGLAIIIILVWKHQK